jgi:hypothetical protein
MVVPPKGKEKVPYTRATTIANSLDDASALVAWKMRMAAVGLTSRPDLLAAITEAGEDKGLINAYIEEAMDTAGASKAANIGTAIHALTERLDLGQELGEVPEQWMPDIKAYAEATKNLNMYSLNSFQC